MGLLGKLKAKAIDKVTDSIFGGFGGRKGRSFGFGGTTPHPTRSSQHGTLDYRSHFHSVLTDEIYFQTPNRSLWYIVIDDFPKALNTSTLQLLECGGHAIVDGLGPNKTNHYQSYDGMKSQVDNKKLQNQQGGKDQTSGCLFAQGVNLPTEQMSTSRVSVENNRGFIPGLVGGARNEFNPLSIEFRETNGSFVDAIMRPWVTLASHYGFVARGRDDPKNIKTNITVSQIGVNGHDMPFIRKQTIFHNCVPFQIAQQQYTYDTDGGSVPPIDVQWVYTNYSLKTATTGGEFNESEQFLDYEPGAIGDDAIINQFNNGPGSLKAGELYMGDIGGGMDPIY